MRKKTTNTGFKPSATASSISSLLQNALSGGIPARASAPMSERGGCHRHPLSQSSHLADVGLLVRSVHDRAGGEEEHRLRDAVHEQVEYGSRVAARAKRKHHEPQVAHRGVRQDALQVRHHQRHRRAHERRDEADGSDGQLRAALRRRTAGRAAPRGTRPPSPSLRRGSARSRALGLPSRRAATRAAGTAPTCPSRRRRRGTHSPSPLPGSRPGRPTEPMISMMSTVPNSTMSSTTPMSRPTSPILVVTNAFFAASAAERRSNQKPMSR